MAVARKKRRAAALPAKKIKKKAPTKKKVAKKKVAKKKATKKATKKAPAKKKVAKKKAPPKHQTVSAQRRRVARAKAVVKPEVIEALMPDEELGTNTIRIMAANYYAANIDTSIAKMAQHPVFGKVHKATLDRWSMEDGWGAQRKQMENLLRERLQEAVGDELVRMRTAQVATLQSIFDSAVARIEANITLGDGGEMSVIPSKSFEGMVNSITNLARALDGMRSNLGASVPSKAFGGDSDAGGPSMPMTPKLSEEEARSMAKFVMEQRLKVLRGE